MTPMVCALSQSIQLHLGHTLPGSCNIAPLTFACRLYVGEGSTAQLHEFLSDLSLEAGGSGKAHVLRQDDATRCSGTFKW